MMKNRRHKVGKRTFPSVTEAPDFQWSKHSYTLDHITNNFRLPCAVKCNVGSCSLDWSVLHFDLSQPLLLHSNRCGKKVKASVLKLDPEKGELRETGGCVVIPLDYDGWFTRLDDPVEKYLPSSTLESVIGKDPEQVLVANSISCLCLTDSEQGHRHTERKQISSGEILHIKRTDVTGSLTRRSPPSKYLVCTDEKDKEMYLPFSQNGKFYKVNNAFTDDGLFQIKDIAENKSSFPVKVRHVLGDVPVFASEYSSYLQCFDVVEEDTAVASTIDDDLLLLELQIKTPLKFYIALNEASIKQTEYYSDAFQNCETEGEDYARSIKFSFTLSPESYSVCNSLMSLHDDESSTDSFYTESELGEIDAQYEFTIKWEPTEAEETNTIRPDKQYEFTINSEPIEAGDTNTNCLDKNHVPKIFNSSINSPKNSTESTGQQWNEEPETV